MDMNWSEVATKAEDIKGKFLDTKSPLFILNNSMIKLTELIQKLVLEGKEEKEIIDFLNA